MPYIGFSGRKPEINDHRVLQETIENARSFAQKIPGLRLFCGSRRFPDFLPDPEARSAAGRPRSPWSVGQASRQGLNNGLQEASAFNPRTYLARVLEASKRAWPFSSTLNTQACLSLICPKGLNGQICGKGGSMLRSTPEFKSGVLHSGLSWDHIPSEFLCALAGSEAVLAP